MVKKLMGTRENGLCKRSQGLEVARRLAGIRCAWASKC